MRICACCLLLVDFLLGLLFGPEGEIVHSTKMLDFYQTIQQYIPEDNSYIGHRHENLKFNMRMIISKG
jgi:hypothetical protein